MKCRPPKIDNHKHNILNPLVTSVRIIFKKGLNRVHHGETFGVSSNNNKCKYALHWYSLMSISSKYTLICTKIRFNNSIVQLFVPFENHFWQFHFLQFPNCVLWWISKIFKSVVCMKRFFEEELIKVENGKLKCPHILYEC